MHIEACVENPADGLLAEQAGATRIELNAALQLDGLTPSPAACRWLTSHCQVPVIAMLRPHARSFTLSRLDQQLALADCELLLDCGVHGIACGALDHHGELNLEFFRQVAGLCGSCELVCHRAFDHLSDQRRGLEQLIDCGVRRVLTSGGPRSAYEGTPRLRQLVDWARGRIEILPAGGITAQNARSLLQSTGCNQLHGTFRTLNPVAAPGGGLDPDHLRAVVAACAY